MSRESTKHPWPVEMVMPGADPQEEVRVEETPDGVRYVMPGRVLGGGHVFGAAVVVAGIVIVLGGLWWMMAILLNGRSPWPDVLLDLIGPAAVGLIGTVIWMSGLFIANGRSELAFRSGPPATLVRIEQTGLLKWTTRSSVARLNRLRIDLGLSEDITIDEALTTGLTVPLASLVAEYEGGRTARLLTAYPPHWLEPLARDLADRLAAHPSRHEATSFKPEVIVHDPRSELRHESAPSDQDRPHDDANHQPPQSDIELTRSRDGMTITIPPLGIWRGRAGGVSASSAWSGIVAAFTGSAVGMVNSPLYVSAGIAAVWGLGSLFVLAAVAIGRRSAIVDVVEDAGQRSLLITLHSLFGVKQHGWSREELRTIECGSSGMEVGERPVMELHITPASGGTASFFTGRDEEELRWLAQVLRDALDLPDEAPARSS